MAGEAILAFVPDLMFSVRLREAAANFHCTVSIVSNDQAFIDRLQVVKPSIVVLDLAAVGPTLESLVRQSKEHGSRVLAYAAHAKRDLVARAQSAQVDDIYASTRFKTDINSILGKWLLR